jgi:hypothetical protein
LRGLSILFVVALSTAACATAASAAGVPGVADASGPGGDGATGPRVSPEPSRGLGGALRAPSPGGPTAGARSPRGGRSFRGASPGAGDHVPAIDGRHRTRRYWFGGGPIFVPEPGGDFFYGDVDYDDGGDPTGCMIFRKAFSSDGRFLGWAQIDLCEGQ